MVMYYHILWLYRMYLLYFIVCKYLGLYLMVMSHDIIICIMAGFHLEYIDDCATRGRANDLKIADICYQAQD